MKKILILLCLSLLLTGCGKDVEYYEDISEIIIGFNKDLNYSKKGIKEEDLKAIEYYKNSLENIGYKINLSKFVVKIDKFKTDEPNSDKIFIENGDCYINRPDINFVRDHGPSDDRKKFVCNGYSLEIFSSDIIRSYDAYIKTRKHGYRYLGYKQTENGYLFGYRSFLNANITTIELVIKSEKVTKIIYKENQLEKFE